MKSMKMWVRTIYFTLTTTILLAGCMPHSNGRYYIQEENLPNGTITRVFDSKTNTELLHIAELSLDPPSISVLPMSRLDVSSVSIGPNGEENVLVAHFEENHQDKHAVMVTEPSPGALSSLTNIDVNRDGIAETRNVRFLVEKQMVSYTDLNADGIFDTQYITLRKSESERSARILVGQTWIEVDPDGAVMAFSEPPHTVASLESPPVTYHFQEGAWKKE